MTILWAAVALLAALDPFGRARRSPGVTSQQSAVAAVVVAVVVAALGLVADPLLESLDVSAPTMVIAAGLVLVAVSTVRLAEHSGVFGRRSDVVDVDDDAVIRGVIPLAFPLLLAPVVGVVTLAAGATLGAGSAILAAVPALLAWIGALQVGSDTALRAAAGAIAVVGIVAGVVLAVDGVFTL